jgi:ribosome-associated heat shock protein Hsp15
MPLRPVAVGDLNSGSDAAGTRIDVWLWAARFFRTRSLAKQAVETGKVEVGGQRAKPSRTVRVGDALRVTRGDEVFEIEVRGVSENRGAASVAQALYSESESSRMAREARRAELRAARAGYSPPQGKPDKRARRLIRALGDIDTL